MKRIFITYADANYAAEGERICEEARATDMFDETRVYTPNFDFPEGVRKYINEAPKGGGYWLWKPLIIQDALKSAEVGDIVVYADAGSTLHKHWEWNDYFRRLNRYELLLFRIKGKLWRWCAGRVPETLFIGRPDVNNLSKKFYKTSPVMAGVLIVKKTKEGNRLIDMWAETAVSKPQLFADSTNNIPDTGYMGRNGFRQHRHDQSVLNVLLLLLNNAEKKKICILPEHFEHILYGGQAITVTRKSSALNRHHEMPRKGWLASLFIRMFNL